MESPRKGMSRREVAKELGISTERVQQIEEKALRKLRRTKEAEQLKQFTEEEGND